MSAERTRFELVVGLLLRQFSKLVVSATHPPLQCFSSFALASAKIDRVFEFAKYLAIIFQKKFWGRFELCENCATPMAS